jgi:WD40 repeat protein
MAKLRVTIIDEVRNRRFKVDLPDDAAMEKLLPALAKKLALPTTDSGGQPVAYQLTHEATGRALGGDQTLASFGVKESDALRLAAAREEAPAVLWPSEEEAVPLWQKVPVWGWALGALVVLATVVIAFSTLGPKVDNTVLFTSDRDGKREIYRLIVTGELERVTYTPGNGESWSPAPEPGGTVLFTSDRDGKREVYRLTGTGEVVRVTYTPSSGESWSPVPELGGSVLFTSDRDGKREVYRLTRTGELVQITHTPGDGESWLPAH